MLTGGQVSNLDAFVENADVYLQAVLLLVCHRTAVFTRTLAELCGNWFLVTELNMKLLVYKQDLSIHNICSIVIWSPSHDN
jgi:hypothetical protein